MLYTECGAALGSVSVGLCMQSVGQCWQVFGGAGWCVQNVGQFWASLGSVGLCEMLYAECGVVNSW